MNFYNEHDPRAAEWLRELITAELIPFGVVDERDIQDIPPHELTCYTQCHFFAGIGGWSEALRLAGVPDDFPIWSGSCPCQPFSASGKRLGVADERHLWPAFKWAIECQRPPVVIGEQVASPLGREWLAGVRVDLEAMGYEVGAADLCAAGVGAPHIRQRLYWMAHRMGDTTIDRREVWSQLHDGQIFDDGRDAGGMVFPHSAGRNAWESSAASTRHGNSAESTSDAGGMGDADDSRSQGWRLRPVEDPGQRSPWASGAVVIPCADGKTRRIKPSIQPLAYGFPDRVALLRGSGNAIVSQIAAEFIMAGLESICERRPCV